MTRSGRRSSIVGARRNTIRIKAHKVKTRKKTRPRVINTKRKVSMKSFTRTKNSMLRRLSTEQSIQVQNVKVMEVLKFRNMRYLITFKPVRTNTLIGMVSIICFLCCFILIIVLSATNDSGTLVDAPFIVVLVICLLSVVTIVFALRGCGSTLIKNATLFHQHCSIAVSPVEDEHVSASEIDQDSVLLEDDEKVDAESEAESTAGWSQHRRRFSLNPTDTGSNWNVTPDDPDCNRKWTLKPDTTHGRTRRRSIGARRWSLTPSLVEPGRRLSVSQGSSNQLRAFTPNQTGNDSSFCKIMPP